MLRIGVIPITDHYYDPLLDVQSLRGLSFAAERQLPGVKLNHHGQLDLLANLNYESELSDVPIAVDKKHLQQNQLAGVFCFNNGYFESGDAEFLYQMIRHLKPRKLVEIGCGNSTLIARRALEENKSRYECAGEHVCIEPFEVPWLEKTGIAVMRTPVQHVDTSIFQGLSENDILFIDSSHIIKPSSDVLFIYQKILPLLNPGVIVHVHDIFTPRHYLEEWMREDIRFWNEQYLLEAFLTDNDRWQVVAALNWLKHSHYEEIKRVCPYLEQNREPGSFYLRKLR